MFLYYHILFKYLIKALESLTCFKPVLSRLLIINRYFALNGSYNGYYINEILSISGYWFIRWIDEFLFPDPEPPIINILYNDQEFLANLDYVILCFLL